MWTGGNASLRLKYCVSSLCLRWSVTVSRKFLSTTVTSAAVTYLQSLQQVFFFLPFQVNMILKSLRVKDTGIHMLSSGTKRAVGQVTQNTPHTRNTWCQVLCYFADLLFRCLLLQIKKPHKIQLKYKAA